MNLNMKKPCANCPFLKKGAIDLAPGRLIGIAQDAINDDTMPFLCHKSVQSSKNPRQTIIDENGDEQDLPGQSSSICVGSMVFLKKAKSPNVAMRMGAALKLLDPKALDAFDDVIIDPEVLLKGNILFGSKRVSGDARASRAVH